MSVHRLTEAPWPTWTEKQVRAQGFDPNTLWSIASQSNHVRACIVPGRKTGQDRRLFCRDDVRAVLARVSAAGGLA